MLRPIYTSIGCAGKDRFCLGFVLRPDCCASVIKEDPMVGIAEKGVARRIIIATEDGVIEGDLFLPENPLACILLVETRQGDKTDRFIARTLQDHRFAAVTLELLPAEAELFPTAPDLRSGFRSFVGRLRGCARWLRSQEKTTRGLPIGYYGEGIGAAIALEAAAEGPEEAFAVVCCEGRPELAQSALATLRSPTLLIVGSDDLIALNANRRTAERLHCVHRLEIVQGATRLLDEDGALDAAARSAADWFMTCRFAPRGERGTNVRNEVPARASRRAP